VVTPGDRTQAVPKFTGPRTDVVRRGGVDRRRAWTSVAVVVVLLAAAGAGYYLFNSKSSTVTMPNLRGESITQATTALRQDGFSTPITELVNSSAATGTVVGTNPKAGTSVSTTSQVTLMVSKGTSTQPVTVPNEIGKSLSVAEAALQSIGLAYKTIWETSTTTTGTGTGTGTSSTSTTQPAVPNTVLNQSPVGGTADQTGDTVELYVLAPTSTFPVPSLSGDTVTQAAAALGQAGLTVSAKTSSQCSNTTTQGLVISTTPTAGTQVQAGASVELVTSSGFCQVVVPNVVGQVVTTAESTLTQVGLVPSLTTANPADCTQAEIGSVQSQSAAAGSFLNYNGTVVLAVCDSATGTTTTAG
jgi:serine/threonine-protein kinase